MKTALQKLRSLTKGSPRPAKTGGSVDEALAAQSTGDVRVSRSEVYIPGAIVASGTSLQSIGERIAIILRPGLGKIGLLFMPTGSKTTRSQTFTRADVIAHGSKVKQAIKGTVIIVSEYFGDEVTQNGRVLRVGRERDIVGVWDKETDHIMPVGDRLLLKEEEGDQRAGLLWLPADMREKQFVATVVGSGPDAKPDLRQRVLVPKDRAVVVRIDGQKLLLIEEDAILAIL